MEKDALAECCPLSSDRLGEGDGVLLAVELEETLLEVAEGDIRGDFDVVIEFLEGLRDTGVLVWLLRE